MNERRQQTSYPLRLPDEIRDRTKALAAEYGRSMNAQVVVMLQHYFETLDRDVGELQQALEKRSKAMERAAAYELSDLKIAMLKVLRFEEFMILQNRVADIGGTDYVLETPASELMKKISGESIQRTDSEAQSYYSQVVGKASLTTLLTTEEIEKIAERLVDLEKAHKALKTGAATAIKEKDE
ncbi:Arc family DNA-binding protein [Achromobacter xylosoxidans]